MPLALRRALYFGPVLLITAATSFLAATAAGGLPAPARWAVAALVGFNALWLALAGWQVVIGFVINCLGRRHRTHLGRQLATVDAVAHLRGRTALLFTIHNEDPWAVFARVRVMTEALAASPDRSAVDIFVLSDTRDPDIAAAEEVAHAALLAAVPSGPVTYRRRTRNTGRKAGNVADFCVSHGDRYDYMILLDADSLMTARTVKRLIRLMEANPQAALLQTVTYQVGLETLFARIHQFSARVYVPLSMLGLDFWQAGQGNYWGHNAILRIDAYRAHCELPVLSGRPPLGGEILCHDTVEAALLHRAGWETHIVPELEGSYEEMPANFVDLAGRCRRWCQGNLQHVRLLWAPGLPWVSRMQLAIGIGTYASAPVWLAIGAFALGVWLPVGGPSPSDAQLAGFVTASMLAMIVVPKLLGIVAVLVDPPRRRLFGGTANLLASAALEQLHASLMWPARMVLYARFVTMTLLGCVVAWDAQPRGDRALSFEEARRRLRGPVLLGAVIAAGTLYLAPASTTFVAPIAVGLLLSPIVASWTSGIGLGRRARRHRLFLTPDETQPAPELRRLGDALAGPGEAWHVRGRPTPANQRYARPSADPVRAEA